MRKTSLAIQMAMLSSIASIGCSHALPVPLKNDTTNFYISYYSPADVTTQVTYQKGVGVNSTIIWEISGDVDPVTDQAKSLIYALYDADQAGYSIGYWTDWSIYPTSRALPYTAYFIPGAIDPAGNKIQNQNFDNKANYLNALVYSFLEIAPDGTIYFNDPWSDLLKNDAWCLDGLNPSCSYAYTSIGKPYAAQYGNFEALAEYSNGKSLDKYMSVGGYGHDISFEQIFGNPEKIETFANTTLAILEHYKLQGIDLDYENPNMSALQSQRFGELVHALNNKLAGTQYKIMVTILASPEYLKGQLNGNQGFATNVLSSIASLTAVKSINLMTYDFYGAFNYNPNGTGRTGFIADTYSPDNAPQGSINFSAQASIETLINLDVPVAKISGGIPTYGRALQTINSVDGLNDPTSGHYSGLYATIPSTAVIPRGDLDDISCNQSIYPLTANSCSGSYTYAYILSNFNNNTFTTVDWKNDAAASFNGTTAYTNQYKPPVGLNYNLDITNVSRTGGGQVLTISNRSVNIGQLDWMAPLTTKTYNNATNPSVSAIQGARNLIITWNSSFTGKDYICTAFDFTSNALIKINPETGTCDIQPAPALPGTVSSE